MGEGGLASNFDTPRAVSIMEFLQRHNAAATLASDLLSFKIIRFEIDVIYFSMFPCIGNKYLLSKILICKTVLISIGNDSK